MELLRAAIHAAVAANQPMTCRQVFYALTTQDAIPKTEAGYRSVVRLLGLMREEGQLPFEWIADNTRWMQKPLTHGSIRAALDFTTRTYRRCLWDDMDVAVEVWLEKDALAGVLYDTTAEFDVPLFVTRGYASKSYLYEAATDLATDGVTTFIYYFGDHDPSGLDIPVKVEEALRRYAPEAEFQFERVAVTPEQIALWSLPTRPTKRTDTRSLGFEGGSVELDSIPLYRLRELARDCIERHVDAQVIADIRRTEDQERRELREIARAWESTP
jgi:hypothetical protein